MSEAGSVRRRRSRVEVEKLVAEYEASGLTRDVFCQQRGLSVAALDRYSTRPTSRLAASLARSLRSAATPAPVRRPPRRHRFCRAI
jgi:hypothetical protein